MTKWLFVHDFCVQSRIKVAIHLRTSLFTLNTHSFLVIIMGLCYIYCVRKKETSFASRLKVVDQG